MYAEVVWASGDAKNRKKQYKQSWVCERQKGRAASAQHILICYKSTAQVLSVVVHATSPTLAKG